MIALLFTTGQHRKGIEIVIQHTVAVSPKADREGMLRGLEFDKDGLLVTLNLSECNISTLPWSFSALICSGDLYLGCNQLEYLPANFGELQVGGDLSLYSNQLESLPANFHELEVGGGLWLNSNKLKLLPESFENISVGGDLTLFDKQLIQQPCTFPNVQGDVLLEAPVTEHGMGCTLC